MEAAIAAATAEPEAPGHAEFSRGFPGPTVSGVSLIAAPVLGAIGSALAIGVYNFKGADMMAGMARHHARTLAGINLAVTATVLMVFAVAAIAASIAARRRRLGRAAGVLTIVGLAGPVYYEGMYWGASFLTAPKWQAAGAHLLDGTNQLPNTIVNVSGPALIIGFILLAVGTAKAGVLSRSRAVCLGAAALLPLGFISGYIAISAIGFAVASVALVPLGLRTLRCRARYGQVARH